MDVRELDPTDEAELRRFWEVGRDASIASRPYDLWPAWEAARLQVLVPRPTRDLACFVALEGEEVVGAASVALPMADNTHLADLEVAVAPPHQRRGVGSALLVRLEDHARARGRRTALLEGYAPLDSDSPALAFGRAHDYAPAIEDGLKVLDLRSTEPGWAALEQQAAPLAADYELVGWHDTVPPEHVAGICHVNTVFNSLAPLGDLDLEEEVWDEARVRTDEEHDRRTGRTVTATAALAPDGSMAALTEIVLSRWSPHRASQSGTLVLPGHRGHRLGLMTKLANQRALLRRFPECRLVVTGNASTNAPMNRVNDQLGFRTVERCVEMQRSL